MKPKVILSILVLGIMVSAFGQKPTLELTFTAENNGQYILLDSIFIENLTQGGDTTLHTPDTVLVLDYITNILDNRIIVEGTFSVSQNYPNPFKGKTDVNLYLPEKQNINILVWDVLGRKLTQYENTLERGNHSFTFYSGNNKYYLLSATGNRASKTITMLNANSNKTNIGKCKIVYNKYEGDVIGLKSQKAIYNFVFNMGDELQYTGYAKTVDGIFGSDVITDSPQTNTNYTFSVLKGLRCPGMPIVTDINGNTYNTVQIGTQCWMAENLKTITFQNGTPIPNVPILSTWINLTTSAYVWYDNDSSWKDLYGALYNWYATVDTDGLCPTGWHVPTNDEWTALTAFIGGIGYPHGNELKSCRQDDSPLSGNCNTAEHPRWNQHNTHYGTDDYGFSGLPGGIRSYDGIFYHIGMLGYFWSSTEESPLYSWFRGLGSFYGDVDIYSDDKINGFSVRCIRDY